MEPITISTVITWSYIGGKVLGALAIPIGVFKVINWVKTKFISINNNVIDLKTSMDTHIQGLRDDIKHQTATLATALSEQRQDFRTFYAPTLLMMQQSSAPALRAKKPVKRKIKKK